MSRSRKRVKKKKKIKSRGFLNSAEWNHIWAVIFTALAILVFISLISYNSQDLPYQSSQVNPFPENFAGIIGAYISFALFFAIGQGSFIIPILLLLWAFAKLTGRTPQKLYIKSLGTAVMLLVSSGIMSLLTGPDRSAGFLWGGAVGLFISEYSVRYLNYVGAYLLTSTLLILSMFLATDFMVIDLAKGSLKFISGLFPWARKTILTSVKKRSIEDDDDEEEEVAVRKLRPAKVKPAPAKAEKPAPPKPPAPAKPIITRHVSEKPKQTARPKPVAPKEPEPPKVVSAPAESSYQLPPVDLLNLAEAGSEEVSSDNLEANSQILEDTLRDFGIEVKVSRVDQGPIITRYELQPAPGVKITRITALNDDIALAMKATSVRIVAPIPGKSVVGIEVPNSAKNLVYVRDIIDTKEFSDSKLTLALALGKDTAGKALIADLADMPHLLIAGTTGSGKTVCMNAIIVSLLYRYKPEELKFVMVDPKMVELATFNGLPHLLCPVVTSAKKAAAVLEWVVSQMEERYKLLAKVAARNIKAYNEKVPENRLSYIIVIIDELADLMVVAKGDVENSITRLAQLSRAVGIHIILATQRPSVNVVTGVIKANFPARISFQVASKVDSRTVLDMNGADKLLGKGDMLFMQPGADKMVRGQSSLVSDAEIEAVVNYIKNQKEVEYNKEILDVQEKKTHHRKNMEKDELFDEAVSMILETGQASVSMLQRRLKLSYQRAGRIIDSMEEEGIIGPHRGSKPREILNNTVSDLAEDQDEENVEVDSNDDRTEAQTSQSE